MTSPVPTATLREPIQHRSHRRVTETMIRALVFASVFAVAAGAGVLRKAPCEQYSVSWQCSMVKEPGSDSMYMYVRKGMMRGGTKPRHPLGHKFRKPLLKKICERDAKAEYGFECEGKW